jgi:retinol dehydrogenase 12
VKEVQGSMAHYIITQWLCSDAVFGAYTELYAGLSSDLSLAKGDQGAWIIPWGRKDNMRPDMLEEAKKGEKGLGGKLWDWCESITKEYE